MHITLENTQTITDFPSGSGIAYANGKLYAIGDDTPFLYVINADFQIERKILLYEENEENFKGNRIKKKKKLDFETLEMISDKELVIFGSGSKSPQRDVFVRVILEDTPIIEKYSISAFYDVIKNSDWLKNSELNIEATAFIDGFLYLFNRANNVIIKANYQDFLESLRTNKLPNLMFVRAKLPVIEGVEAGFSGVTHLKGLELIFTASVEATNDAYNDGEIIGSLIGVLDMTNFEQPKIKEFANIPNTEQSLKVESVTVTSISEKDYKLVLITDDDQGNTKLIKIYVKP
ncbi:MAG: hypothetical protein Q4C98_03800 [Capnocytophaga sp.]|nr:hypothetical protein [Capnocytophaga sp.]